MIPDSHPFTPARDLEGARRQLGITYHELWLGYFELGGNGSPRDIARWLAGAPAAVPARDYDMIAHILNEAFSDQDINHPVPYHRA